jgi:hypothetical protein
LELVDCAVLVTATLEVDFESDGLDASEGAARATPTEAPSNEAIANRVCDARVVIFLSMVGSSVVVKSLVQDI